MITRRRMLLGSMVASLGFMLPWAVRHTQWRLLGEHPDCFRNPVVVTRYSDGSFTVIHANSAWDEVPYSEGWVRYCGPRNSELMMIGDSECPLGIKIGYLYLDEGII